MGYRGHICKKRDIEYGSDVASGEPERLKEIFEEIEKKLTPSKKEKYLYGDSAILWSSEYNDDFEIDPKILYSLFEEKKLENLLDFLTKDEKEWLETMYNDIKGNKEYHLNNGYIRIEFF
ncbi:hypothetical protein [Cetobacterium sp.]|uniref:hypothetical protein n=1 Tax=Cetobacterium sp. TaxID=2071632 RepID=UPI003F3C04A4